MRLRFLTILTAMLLLSGCYTKGRFSVTVRDANTGQPVSVDRIEVKKGQTDPKLVGLSTGSSEYMTEKIRYGSYYIAAQDKMRILYSENLTLNRKVQPVDIYVTKPLLELEIVDKATQKQVNGAAVTVFDQFGSQLDSFSYPSKKSMDFPEGLYGIKIECSGYEKMEVRRYLGIEEVNRFEVKQIMIEVPVRFSVIDDKSGSEISAGVTIEVSGVSNRTIDYPSIRKLELAPGSYSLKARCPGYEPYQDAFNLTGPKEIPIRLRPKIISVAFTIFEYGTNKRIDSKATITLTWDNFKESLNYPSTNVIELRQKVYHVAVSNVKDYEDFYDSLDLTRVETNSHPYEIGLKKTPRPPEEKDTDSSDDPTIIKAPPVKRREFNPASTTVYKLKGADYRVTLKIEVHLNDGSKRNHNLYMGKASAGNAAGPFSISIQGILSKYGYNAAKVKKIVIQ